MHSFLNRFSILGYHLFSNFREVLFKTVHIVYGLPNEPAEKGIHLETFSLDFATQSTDLRAPNSLGSRLRRSLNIALQGHIGMLWLHNNDDVERLEALWKRGRITQLLEKHKIMHCHDLSEQLVKLWKVDHQIEESKRVVITIK